MLPYLGILGLAVPIPAFTLLLGLWLALDQIEKKSDLISLDKKFIYNLAFSTLMIGLVGGRVTFFLTNPHLFIENPLGIFSLNSNLISIPGAFLSALIFLIITSNRKQASLLSVFDGFAPGIALFAVFFHFSNFFSGNAFGAEAILPWSINLWNGLRHPVQIYEMIAALIIFFVIFPRKPSPNRKTGLSILYLVSLSSLSKLIFEAFHGDSQTVYGHFRTLQFGALAILVLSIWSIIKVKQSKIKVE